MATSSTIVPSSGHTLGDLTARIDAVGEAAADLKQAYENDATVAGLAEYAATVRGLSDVLCGVFYEIDTALGAF